jgi:hypothetical protein
MLKEPIEEKYTEILKQRLALEGEVAQWKQRHVNDVTRYKQRANRLILLLLLLPLTTFIFKRKPTPSVDWHPIAAQRDSLQILLNNLEKTSVKHIKYSIQKGDNPSSLGLHFYNDEKAAYQIIKDNNLDAYGPERELKTGDTLTIYYR